MRYDYLIAARLAFARFGEISLGQSGRVGGEIRSGVDRIRSLRGRAR